MTAPLSSSLARKWKIDVLTAAPATYTLVRGVAECKFQPFAAKIEEDSVYEDEGWTGATKTELGWSAELKLVRRRTPGTNVYDPGQEKLRALARAFGSAGVAQVRVYDREGGDEAYEGYAEVEWEADGGSTSDLEAITVTLTGKGELAEIVNPDAESGS